MLDKRRLYGLSSCTVVFVFSLFLSICFSYWFFSGFETAEIILVDKNTFVNDISQLIGFLNNSDATQIYPINEFPLDDISTLIDIKNFQFILNHDLCNKTQPFLMLIIHSAPQNFEKRRIIRETWGQSTAFTNTLFFIGSSSKYNNDLIKENQMHNDLIQGNYLDSYRNMTYKHVMALKWVTYYCPNAKFVLKLDDDVFVHMTALTDFLKRFPWTPKRLILCDTLSNSMVRRSYRSKWRVSPLEYPASTYPTYCIGYVILYSSDAVHLLYQEAQRERYFWIDDVHITGTVAKKVNLTRTSMKSMILSRSDMKVILDNQKQLGNPLISMDFFFGPPNLTGEQIKMLHNFVKKQNTIQNI